MPDHSPAEELRAAAKLMRERAAEAEQSGYESTHPGKPWCPEWTYGVVRHVQRNMDSDCTAHPWGTEREGDCNQWGRHAGYHIAAWSPAVALAVADWLDKIAWSAELDADLINRVGGDEALAVARAYLGAAEPAATEATDA